jgi:hypothetical protein
MMLDLIQNGSFGNTAPRQIAFDVDTPAQRVSNLGVLVDSASAAAARDGLHVLAVTPGSAGERMGLRAGDTLVAVNGEPLDGRGEDASGRAQAAAVLRQAVEAQGEGDAIALDVRRDGRAQSLSGTLASVYLPAMHLSVGNGVAVAAAGSNDVDPASAAPVAGDSSSSCGRISVFDVAPRQQHLHAATLLSIDGKLPGPSTAHVYTLDPGVHTLKVGERIESRYLSFNDRLRNVAPNYKLLDVEVQPGVKYYLAARLNESARNEWRDGAYWTPVIWRQQPEPCH